MPHRPRIVRYIFWNFFRNPMMNFRNYVIGVGDRTYTVVGKVPAIRPPVRNIDDDTTRVRKLPVPNMHAFTNANPEEDDE